MTKDDIIRMAREARLHSAVLLHLYGGKESALTNSELDELQAIERFAALVAAAEREACAKVCDNIAACHEQQDSNIGAGAAKDCAEIIRARGENK